MVQFSKVIINWYHKTNRNLPWRNTKNPYNIWLSEVIMQQTKVEQGLPYYIKFTKKFPTIHDLAKTNEETILKLWQGLGYYSRARNLHHTAKYISEHENGIFPKTHKELIKLRGIGDYTASAIASICFNEPNAVVDGNVYRVLSRFFGVKTAINSTNGIKEFKLLAQEILDKTQSGIYNQALMDFGALHCKPIKPLCNNCLLSKSCFAHNYNQVENLPYKQKKIKIKQRFFNYLFVITNNNQTVIEKRTKKGIWQNLYQFPLIETDKTIDQKELIKNNRFKELFPEPTEIHLFNKKEIIHKLSHQKLYTRFWIIEATKVNSKKIDISRLNNYAVPVLIENFIKMTDLI